MAVSAKNDELYVAGIRLQITGEAEFVQSLQSSAKQSTALKNELKVLEAGMTSAGKNGTEYLKIKAESLTSTIAAQEAKTIALKNALANATAEGKADANVTAELEKSILQSEIATAKLTKSLNETNAALSKSENAALKAGEAQKKMGEEAQKTGAQITGLGEGMSKYVTAPALASAVALAALITKSVETADKFQQMADKTGFSTEQLQEFAYVGAKADTTLETIVGSQSKLIRAMSAARDGTEQQTAAFAKLDIAVVNSDGTLRDSNVVFGEAIDKLGQMSNETERDAVSLVLFGKSALDLNPLIKTGSKEIANLTAEARKNGAVMSGENVAALDAFGDSIEAAKLSIGTATGEIAVKMLPTLEKLIPILQEDVIPAIGTFAETIGNLIVGYDKLDPVAKAFVNSIAATILVTGPALTILGKGIQMYGVLAAAKGASTIASASHTTATIASTGAVVAETGAVNALAAAEGTATVAGAGLSTALGPIGLIAAATVAIIAGSKYIIESNMFKVTGGDMDACAASAQNLAASQTSLDASTSAFIAKTEGYMASFSTLSDATISSAENVTNYAAALESASEKMADWDGGIEEAQERISGLAALVAEESREYTDAERAEITELIGIINDYTQKKEELYSTHLQTLEAIAANQKDMTVEMAAEYNKQAQEGYDELQKIADAAYADAVALAIERYGEEGKLNKYAYDNAIEIAQKEREVKLETAKASAQEVIDTTAETFARQNASGVEYLQLLTQLKNDEQAIKLERNQAIIKANEDLAATEEYQNADVIRKWQLVCEAEAKVNAEYDQKIIDADAKLAAAQSDAQADQAAALIGLVQSMADAGVEIDKNTLDAVNAYLEAMGLATVDATATAEEIATALKTSFEGYHSIFYGLGEDAINGLIEGMNSKGPDMTASVETQAANIEKIYRKKLQTNSPSKVMIKAARDTWDGVIVGTEDKEGEIREAVETMSGIVEKTFDGVMIPGLADSRSGVMGSYSSIALPRFDQMNNMVAPAPVISSPSTSSVVDASTSVSFPNANITVRKDSDINQIAEQLARLVSAQKKAVGANG